MQIVVQKKHVKPFFSFVTFLSKRATDSRMLQECGIQLEREAAYEKMRPVPQKAGFRCLLP
jgi:hypothetical protein